MRFANSRIAQIAQTFGLLRDRGATAVGWGRKPSGTWASATAGRSNADTLLLEDGFLRSVANEEQPLSVVLDDIGIYYDAASPSRLEALIAQPIDDAAAARARRIGAFWREGRVSKYNGARELPDGLGDGGRPYVLVCDQTFGDLSIQYGGAGAETFHRMLEAALAENPDHDIIVKVHPDIVTKRKRGHFDLDTITRWPRVGVIADARHPAGLLERADAVYVVTSQMGFEALLWGRPVRVFGMPFYAGWGLTRDELPAPARRGTATLEQLVHAALVAYPRYVDPETGESSTVEATIGYLSDQMRQRRRFPEVVYALGFSRWKRRILPRFLAGSEVRFVKRLGEVPARATLALWGRAAAPDLAEGVRVIRLEDGFLRSVGLGADLTAPVSWVCDDVGIYYDAGQPSRLEVLLAETVFDDDIRRRAAALRRTILAARLTKYNLTGPAGGAVWRRPDGGRRVILVPGQVESDASIRFGAAEIRTNIGLVSAVRASNPDAYVVYKPHPDVVAGLRRRGAEEAAARRYCDEVLTSADMAQLLDEVDEVHTLTSLTGFEALLRGVPVTCYGRPFYAGWGLTDDKAPLRRRSRRLDLDALVAGALILYPTYVSRVTGRFTTPERAIAELVAWRDSHPGRPPVAVRALRLVLRTWKRWSAA
jgi:capsular polysaccharide export protein